MQLSGKVIFRRTVLLDVIFFTPFVCYLWIIIEPRLIYHAFGILTEVPALRVDWPYLLEQFTRPGGTADYVAAILSNTYCYSFIGAAVVTTVAWILAAGTRTLFSLAGTRLPALPCYGLPILSLVMLGQYADPLRCCICLAIVLWTTILYERVALARPRARPVLFVVLLVLLYLTAGGASLLFTVLACGVSVIARRDLRSMWYLPLGLAVPWLVGGYVLELPMPDVYVVSTPFVNAGWDLVTSSEKAAYAYIPAVTVLVAVWGRIMRRQAPATARQGRLKYELLRFSVTTALLTALSAGAAWASFNGHNKGVHQILCFSRCELWPDLLTFARRHPIREYGHYGIHATNRALYHTGRLGYDFFSFPQPLDALLLSRDADTDDPSRWWHLCGTAMDLGDVNLAEKMAFELLENKGSSPETLERLATTSLAKGHTETAKVFLNALEKHLVHGRHARNLLQRLDSESEFCSPEAEVLRSMMIAGTGAVFPVGEPAFLLQLLEHNGGNKMAFEYLMAFALLTRRPDKVAENIRRLPELGYSEIPRLYEEAVLIYQVGTRTNVDLHGMQIAESTRQDFARYLEMARTHGRDTAGLKRAMAPDFGNSFLYYMHFFESGVGR